MLVASILGAAVGAVFLPFLLSTYHKEILVLFMINAMLVLGYRTITTMGGWSFAHTAIMGLGSYTMAILTQAEFGVSFWLTLPLAAVVAGVFSALLSYPVLRTRGFYFFLSTFAAGEALRQSYKQFTGITGGTYGISFIPRPGSILGVSFESTISYYYLVLLFTIVIALFLIAFNGSRLGRSITAVAHRRTPQQIVASGITQVPEGRELFPRMSVMDNLLCGAVLRSDTVAIRKDLDKVFGYFPILERRPNQLARDLSGGELCRGYTDVVDADLSKYVDTIPHAEPMQSVARGIVDRNVLRLIKLWLKTPVEETDGDGKRRMTGGRGSTRGTPQGGIVSPLLAALYMNRFLRYWRITGQGTRFRAEVVNYADDLVILSRGHAREALAWTRQVMTRLGLTLNEAKTSVRPTPLAAMPAPRGLCPRRQRGSSQNCLRCPACS